MRLKLVAGSLVGTLMLLPGQVLAAESSNKLVVAGNCANCHGTDGRSVTPIMPRLAGQERDFILETLRAYKAGSRSGTVMPQLSRGYTDEEFVLLADYFSKQK